MAHDEVEQGQLEVQRGTLEVEQGKLKLAQEALKLESEKYKLQGSTLNLEKTKSRWTSGSIVLSTVVAVIGLLVNGCLQRDIEHRTFRDNFKLKAAEIVMNSSGRDATRDRASALQTLFPEELSEKFATALQPKEEPNKQPKPPEPEKRELVGDPAAKEALIKLLAEHPTQREQIINDWLAVFTDQWPRCLKTPNPCP